MRWSELKNDLRFKRALIIGFFIGFLVMLSGMIREIWSVLRVIQTQAEYDAISQGLNTRIVFWVLLGFVVGGIPALFSLYLLVLSHDIG